MKKNQSGEIPGVNLGDKLISIGFQRLESSKDFFCPSTEVRFFFILKQVENVRKGVILILFYCFKE